MSEVGLNIRADGTAVLVGSLGCFEVDNFECDDCGRLEDFNHQWEHVTRSATGRECAVIWLCRYCGPDSGANLHTKECTHE